MLRPVRSVGDEKLGPQNVTTAAAVSRESRRVAPPGGGKAKTSSRSLTSWTTAARRGCVLATPPMARTKSPEAIVAEALTSPSLPAGLVRRGPPPSFGLVLHEHSRVEHGSSGVAVDVLARHFERARNPVTVEVSMRMGTENVDLLGASVLSKPNE